MNFQLPTGERCQVLSVNVVELFLIRKGLMKEIEVRDGEFRPSGVVFFCQAQTELTGLVAAAYGAFASLSEIAGPPELPIEMAKGGDGAIAYAAPYVLDRDSEGCLLMKLSCVMRLCTPWRVGSDGILVQDNGR